jgi:flagellar motor switch protein FliG
MFIITKMTRTLSKRRAAAALSAVLALTAAAASAAGGAGAPVSSDVIFQRAALETALETRLQTALSSYLGVPNVFAVVNVVLLAEDSKHGGVQKDSKGVEYVLPGVPVDQELTKKRGFEVIRSADRIVRAAIFVGRPVGQDRLDQAKAIAAQILELDPAKGDSLDLKVFQPSPEAKEVKEAHAETRRDILSYTGLAATLVALLGILALSYFLFGPLRGALAQLTEALGKRQSGGGGGGPAAVVAAAAGPSGGPESRGGGPRVSADDDQLFAFIDDESIEGLVQALARENEILVASVLECLPRPMAAKAFALFAPDKRRAILQQARAVRYANPESIKLIEKQIRSKLGFSFGGVRRMSRIIQRADRGTRGAIVEDLRQTDPELAATLRENLVEFEDVVAYDDKVFSRIFRDAGMAPFARFLKASDAALTERVASKLAPDAAELLREQVSFMPPVAPEAAEEEFLKIVDAVERLKAAGLISAADKVAAARE